MRQADNNALIVVAEGKYQDRLLWSRVRNRKAEAAHVGSARECRTQRESAIRTAAMARRSGAPPKTAHHGDIRRRGSDAGSDRRFRSIATARPYCGPIG